jgi:hypothetical protein
MDRIFGRHQCQLCMRFPSMGWLYVCRQDERFDETCPSMDSTLNAYNAAKDSSLRDQLKAVNLSESVIETAERGGVYTTDQLDTLMVQKVRLHQVIDTAIDRRNNESACCTPTTKLVGLGINTGDPTARKDSAMSDAAPKAPQLGRSTENNPPNNDGAGTDAFALAEQDLNAGNNKSDPPVTPLKSKTDSGAPPCTMKVCHHCRPYYKDRIFLSLGAVIADEVPPVTPQEAISLRVSNVEIVRNLGLRHPPQRRLLTDEDGEYFTGEVLPSSDSQYTIQTTQSETEDLRLLRQGPRNFYNVNVDAEDELKRDFQRFGFRNSLKHSLKQMFRPSRESSSEGSTITLPLPRTGIHRERWADEADEFDLGTLKRVRSHRRVTLERENESSQSSGGFTSDIDHVDGSSSSSCYSDYSSLSEGSEVEVEGGVALTEESVEKHTPDIITEEFEQQQQTQEAIKSAINQIMTQV